MAMNNNFSINDFLKGITITAKTDAEPEVKVDTATKINEAAEKRIRIETCNPYPTAQQSIYDSLLKSMEAAERKRAEEEKKQQESEEWVWITGYKGTNKDMKCRDQQYELGKQFTMPKDADIVDCHCGFHLCKELKDVFNYYDIIDGHRFFEVQALVRKADAEEYGKKTASSRVYLFTSDPRDKLAAKSIILTRELTVDEILNAHPRFSTMTAEWTPEQRQEAVTTNVYDVRNKIHAAHLTTLGYSEAFAKYVVKQGYYDEAVAVSAQEDLSMDMRVVAILEM